MPYQRLPLALTRANPGLDAQRAGDVLALARLTARDADERGVSFEVALAKPSPTVLARRTHLVAFSRGRR